MTGPESTSPAARAPRPEFLHVDYLPTLSPRGNLAVASVAWLTGWRSEFRDPDRRTTRVRIEQLAPCLRRFELGHALREAVEAGLLDRRGVDHDQHAGVRCLPAADPVQSLPLRVPGYVLDAAGRVRAPALRSIDVALAGLIRLRPDRPLGRPRIASLLGVTRSQVRESLRRLRAAGLVRSVRTAPFRTRAGQVVRLPVHGLIDVGVQNPPPEGVQDPPPEEVQNPPPEGAARIADVAEDRLPDCRILPPRVQDPPPEGSAESSPRYRKEPPGRAAEHPCTLDARPHGGVTSTADPSPADEIERRRRALESLREHGVGYPGGNQFRAHQAIDAAFERGVTLAEIEDLAGDRDRRSEFWNRLAACTDDPDQAVDRPNPRRAAASRREHVDTQPLAVAGGTRDA